MDLKKLSKEIQIVEKQRKDYVETTSTDVSNLIKELEEISKETKSERTPRIPRKKGQPDPVLINTQIYILMKIQKEQFMDPLGFKDVKTGKRKYKRK